ncbi:methyltransferase [Virgisporangium ochraceum]|uniref:SAM-dependent methyltransferase n=1 Tax=Virgisporangium ochraceum TaxID=65505 RepID=A0A8J3ZXQ7_9ACTN|nr:class I SAM-dependent methyltransferase [Virgisporangium ochraceum]GIJ70425.1 SAM-dependent methyltransferase [Virgisporangium ochraceum]
MPLDLPPDEVRAYLRTADAPTPMLDLVGLMAAQAAVTAVEVGVFEALGAEPRDADDLAAALGLRPDGLAVLLDTLVAVGYLDREGRRYANRPATERWLGASGGYAGVLSLWVSIVTELWGTLPSVLRGRAPRADFHAWLVKDPDRLERFQRLQRGLAGWLADEVVERMPVPDGASRLLDLGGGHGWYSVAFCRRYPALTATVVDLPAAVDIGRDVVAAEGLADRVAFHGGDLTDGDLTDGVGGGAGHDVVLLFNVVHGFDPDRARDLVRAAVAATRPGGIVAVLETEPQARAGVVEQAFTRCFALNLWHTQGGQVYPPVTLATWLVEAGCDPPRELPLHRSPTHVLLMARRRGGGSG